MKRSQPRTAILGAGFIAEFHVRALRELGIPVVAVCDLDGAKARSLAAKHSIASHFDSPQRMLASKDVDLVHIVLPPQAHARAVLDCLEAGRDVFVEKPMATSSAECRQIETAARATGRTVGVNHNHCYHPALVRLEEHIRDWRLGAVDHIITWFNLPLRQLSAKQHSHWMFRSIGNILLEQAVHPLSHILHLLGPVRAARVLTTGEVRLNTGNTFLSSWHCSLECERGTALLLMSFGKTHLDLQTSVIGEDATCRVDVARNICTLSKKTRFMKQVDDAANAWGDGTMTLSQGIGGLLDYCLAFLKLRSERDAFYSSIRHSIAAFHEDLAAGRPPRQGIEQGTLAVAACEMIEAARAYPVAREVAVNG
jgi:predicted dehydrogenase